MRCIGSTLITNAEISASTILCISYDVGYVFHSLIIFGSYKLSVTQ